MKCPILSSRTQELAVEDILGFDSISDLVEDIVESKVNALSYSGFDNLQEWCDSKGIPILVPGGAREEIVEIIATRNIIVHNRGVVNGKYRRTVEITGVELGDIRNVDVDYVIGASNLLNSVTFITDAAVAGKFQLERSDVDEEIKQRSAEKWGDGSEGEDKPSSDEST